MKTEIISRTKEINKLIDELKETLHNNPNWSEEFNLDESSDIEGSWKGLTEKVDDMRNKFRNAHAHKWNELQ